MDNLDILNESTLCHLAIWNGIIQPPIDGPGFSRPFAKRFISVAPSYA